ncbi:hypothetical protein PILCRDRAFT_84795 [Piloderma croceum F 1598]|uniref:DUF6534 domain-containing protein n=1 Tax=Piloderma croceum (strain F 1598) TaxID=765440 RepID=A0A0C3BU03_PILCF|nr:hypothetical protein PILCRDRAFT_84795 [Piloderma croceum F 1598]
MDSSVHCAQTDIIGARCPDVTCEANWSRATKGDKMISGKWVHHPFDPCRPMAMYVPWKPNYYQSLFSSVMSVATPAPLDSVPALDSNLYLADTYGLWGIVVRPVVFSGSRIFKCSFTHSLTKMIVSGANFLFEIRFLDAFHLALVSHSMYFYLISNYANPLELTHVVWNFHLQLIVNVVTVSLSSLYRHFTLIVYGSSLRLTAGTSNGNSHLGLWCVAVSFFVLHVSALTFQTSLVIGATAICVDFAKMDLIKWSNILALTTASAVDVLIAVSLCFTLARLRTGFEKTDSMLKSLMLYVLNTGVLTSLCSLAVVSLPLFKYVAYPHNFIFLAVELPMTKLYNNAFVAMFNHGIIFRQLSIKLGIHPTWGVSDSGSSRRPDSEEHKTAKRFGILGTLMFSRSVVEIDDSRSVYREESINEDETCCAANEVYDEHLRLCTGPGQRRDGTDIIYSFDIDEPLFIAVCQVNNTVNCTRSGGSFRVLAGTATWRQDTTLNLKGGYFARLPQE